jgi:di/tricarboxylate transporter
MADRPRAGVVPALSGAGDPLLEQIQPTDQMWLVVAILAFLIYLLLFNVVRVDVAAIIVMVLLGLAGLVPAEHLFDGFSSNAVIAIIATMIMGAGLDRTGIMEQVAGYILRVSGSTERRVTPVVAGAVSLVSSFVQNVGAAALFLPVASRISTRTGIPLSRLLMPVGFCAILGGTVTMVGSSPLIVLNDLIRHANATLPQGAPPMEAFHLFAVTPVGIALVAAGIAYFTFAGHLVLPSAKGTTPDPGATARHFQRVYGIKGEIFEAIVTLQSPLAGRTVGQVEAQGGVPFILGLRNGDRVRIAPPRDEMIYVGTVFALMGEQDEIRNFTRRNRLVFRKDMESFVDVLNPSRAGISAVVIPPDANVVGKSIGELQMRKRWGMSVLAVQRGENTYQDDLRSLTVKPGDTMVLHSRWDDLHQLAGNRNFVVVTDYPRAIMRPHKVWHALGFFLLSLGLMLFADLRISFALMVGAVGMIASGVLTMDEAYRSVSWQTVFLLAGLIPLGFAMETTGTAAWLAQEALSHVGRLPAWGVQATIAVLATFFSLVVSNVGATVLLVPLAVKIALGIGASPAVFALTVALGACNAFLIPTNQVNALVMGPAGYRVADFIRAGSLMTVLFLGVMLVAVDLVF